MLLKVEQNCRLCLFLPQRSPAPQFHPFLTTEPFIPLCKATSLFQCPMAKTSIIQYRHFNVVRPSFFHNYVAQQPATWAPWPLHMCLITILSNCDKLCCQVRSTSGKFLFKWSNINFLLWLQSNNWATSPHKLHDLNLHFQLHTMDMMEVECRGEIVNYMHSATNTDKMQQTVIKSNKQW